MNRSALADLLRDRQFRWIAALTVLVAVAAALASQLASERTADWLFSEAGPIEGGSVLLWIVLAAACLSWGRRSAAASVAGAVLALAAAAREASLHVRFTDYSILKLPYYYRSEHGWQGQMISGAVVVAVGICAILVAHRLWRSVRADRRALAPWKAIAVLGVVLIPLTKVLDRAPDVLRGDWGIHVHPDLVRLLTALEESLELMIPVVILVALVGYRGGTGAHPQSASATTTSSVIPTMSDYVPKASS